MIEIVLKRKNGELVKVRWTHVDDKGVSRVEFSGSLSQKG